MATNALSELFDPTLVQVLLGVVDSDGVYGKIVQRPIVENKVPGKFDLDSALFPPRNIHRSQVAINVTIDIGHRTSHEMSLMVSGVIFQDNNDAAVIGIMTPEYAKLVFVYGDKKLEDEERFVFVRYSLVTKQGVAFIARNAWEQITRRAFGNPAMH